MANVDTQAKTNTSTAPEKYGDLFKPVVEKCEGCERVTTVNEKQYCASYSCPEAKWKLGICNFATHVKPEIVTAKTRVNPIKASKRAMGGRK